MSKQFYAGSMGPYIYDDALQYPDGEFVSGFYGPEAKIINAPTNPLHATNKLYVDTKISLAVNPLILIDGGSVPHRWQLCVQPDGVLFTIDLGPVPGI